MGIYMGMYVWCEWDIQYADPDPGGQKWPTKNGKPTKCDVLNLVLRIRILDKKNKKLCAAITKIAGMGGQGWRN